MLAECLGSGAAVATRTVRDGVAAEVADQPEGDHEAAGEREDDQEDHQDGHLGAAVTLATERLAEELAQVAEGAAEVFDRSPGVVHLGERVPGGAADGGEVAALVGYLERVGRDREAGTEDGEDDGDVPEVEDRLHHFLRLVRRQIRLFAAGQDLGRGEGQRDEDGHREADAGLDRAAPEEQLAEPATLGRDLVPRRTDRVAVPHGDGDVQEEDADEKQHVHRGETPLQRT